MNQKLLLTLFAILFSMLSSQAQQSRTIDVASAGSLGTILGEDINTVVNLSLTGTINTTDFITIQRMTALKNLDLLNVNLENDNIPNSAFANRIFNKLVLPKSLKRIGTNAFENMVVPALDFSVCPELTNLGAGAFNGLIKDKDPNILDFSTNSKLVNFEVSYRGNSNWMGTFGTQPWHIILPHNLSYIPKSTFEYFEGSVEIPSTVDNIGDRAFKDSKPKGGIILPKSLKRIGTVAFANMVVPALDFSVCPELTNLGAGAFNGLIKDKDPNILDFSTNSKLVNFEVYYMGNSNWMGTFGSQPWHVILPHNLSYIPKSTFEYFEGSVEIPSTVDHIGDRAFKDSKPKGGIILPKSLKRIGTVAFANMVVPALDFSACPELTNLGAGAFNGLIKDKDPNILDFSTNSKLVNFEVYYMDNSDWMGTFGTQPWHVILPHNLSYIPKSTFEYFEGSVEIPSTVDHIGDRAFKDSKPKGGIILPKSLKRIGTVAFANMVVPALDFSACPELTNLGAGAFNGLIKDKDPNILDFSTNSKLVNFEVYYMGNSDWMGTFGTQPWHVILPDDLKSLPNWSFSHFTGIIDLPLKLRTIATRVFSNATIEEISLPRSVTYIGDNSFTNCTKLTKIISNNPTPPSLGRGVFSNVDVNNCRLTVPDRGLALYSVADQWKDFINTMRSVSGVRALDLNILEQEENTVNIYPNPTTSILNVNADNVQNIGVYSVDGRLIISESNTKSINLQNIANGIYLVKIKTLKGTTTHKIIKK